MGEEKKKSVILAFYWSFYFHFQKGSFGNSSLRLKDYKMSKHHQTVYFKMRHAFKPPLFVILGEEKNQKK